MARPLLDEPDADSPARELQRALRAGEAGADDGDHRRHAIPFPAQAPMTSNAYIVPQQIRLGWRVAPVRQPLH